MIAFTHQSLINHAWIYIKYQRTLALFLTTVVYHIERSPNLSLLSTRTCITFILIWLRQLLIFLTLEPLKLYILNVTHLVWLTRSPLNRVATNRVNLTWLPVGFLILLYCFRVPVIGGFASVGIPCHCLCIRLF